MTHLSVMAALVPLLSGAVEPAARIEGGAALPISSPQSQVFGLGPEVVGTVELGLHRNLDLETQLGWFMLPATAAGAPSGTGLFFGVGARVKAPLSNDALIPWLEGLVQFNRTGAINIASFSAALGFTYHFARAFGAGPYARVLHVLAPPAPAGYDAYAATNVSFGLSLELGSTVPETELSALPPPPLTPPDDADGDGLVGTADHCPEQPEDKDGHRDDDGCPDPDNDADGVLDASDECPNEKGPVASKGCPTNDADGDGVGDDVDQCPKKAGPPTSGGCPEYTQVKVTSSKIEIGQKIFFAFGKTTILPKSYPLLDEVAQALVDHSRLCVRIEGHTDSVGSAVANRALSDGRATEVRDYLVAHGIDAARLTSKGYGPDLPLESNASPDGRERNRRVEFVINPCGAAP